MNPNNNPLPDAAALAQKRREVLARCYELILSPHWGKQKKNGQTEVVSGRKETGAKHGRD